MSAEILLQIINWLQQQQQQQNNAAAYAAAYDYTYAHNSGGAAAYGAAVDYVKSKHKEEATKVDERQKIIDELHDKLGQNEKAKSDLVADLVKEKSALAKAEAALAKANLEIGSLKTKLGSNDDADLNPVVQEKPRSKKNPSIPAELAGFDISGKVVKSKPDPFVGLYFDIYRGAWKLDKPHVFQHVVAVKALRTGYNPSSKAQERKDFDDLLTKCLATWLALSHDNIVPLLGVSINFGRFPAMVTSWMINGLLSEYLKSEEEYDQMDLVKGVANGVAYLHSKKIVHSDLRASSVLVDELGNARLADPGLLSVLSNSPLIVTGMMNAPYRWMAPELLKNSSTKANFKTDVYSFTMTSLEIFTAAQPFQDLQDALVPGQVLQNQRPDKPNDVELALWALWADGWNDNPAKRPDMANYVQQLSPLS